MQSGENDEMLTQKDLKAILPLVAFQISARGEMMKGLLQK